jgi:hypothetical protein
MGSNISQYEATLRQAELVSNLTGKGYSSPNVKISNEEGQTAAAVKTADETEAELAARAANEKKETPNNDQPVFNGDQSLANSITAKQNQTAEHNSETCPWCNGGGAQTPQVEQQHIQEEAPVIEPENN